MKVLALISGGKDSIYNIKECMQKGHQIVALGNMYNQTQGQQGKQLDSYMYQTVGTNMSLAISECLQRPLYRRRITGSPTNLTLQYSPTPNDEVQDLFELVSTIKLAHPQINALSTGAIFSTYQKLRVQDICNRLGMTSLAYLWHREQTQLLREMIDWPIKAVVIKVASYGLKLDCLGKELGQLEGLFAKLKQECGMNVCGEGGEFQTLVLDCPLFAQRIVLDQTQVVEVDKNQISPVGYLIVHKYHLEDK